MLKGKGHFESLVKRVGCDVASSEAITMNVRERVYSHISGGDGERWWVGGDSEGWRSGAS